MNVAATQDVRTQLLLPALEAILDGSTPPNAEVAALFERLQAHRAGGSHRLDADLDGKYDAGNGPPIMSAWWEKLANAVMGGRLSPALLEQLADFEGRGNRGGSAWVGWLDKDLRALAGQSVKNKFSVSYCGGGDKAACQAAIWASLEAARQELIAEQGADPAAWTFDATTERTTFTPGVIPDTIRWTNRPTYQQVAQYKGEAR
jgi:hypothetical protein